jgi:hypothetical protein
MDARWVEAIAKRYLERAGPSLTPHQLIGVEAQDLIALVNAAHALAYHERQVGPAITHAQLLEQLAHLLLDMGIDRVQFWAGHTAGLQNPAKKIRTFVVAAFRGRPASFAAELRSKFAELYSMQAVPLDRVMKLKPEGGPRE